MIVRCFFTAFQVFASPSYPPFAKGDDQFYLYPHSWVFRKTSFERPPPDFRGRQRGYFYRWHTFYFGNILHSVRYQLFLMILSRNWGSYFECFPKGLKLFRRYIKYNHLAELSGPCNFYRV